MTGDTLPLGGIVYIKQMHHLRGVANMIVSPSGASSPSGNARVRYNTIGVILPFGGIVNIDGAIQPIGGIVNIIGDIMPLGGIAHIIEDILLHPL